MGPIEDEEDDADEDEAEGERYANIFRGLREEDAPAMAGRWWWWVDISRAASGSAEVVGWSSRACSRVRVELCKILRAEQWTAHGRLRTDGCKRGW